MSHRHHSHNKFTPEGGIPVGEVTVLSATGDTPQPEPNEADRLLSQEIPEESAPAAQAHEFTQLYPHQHQIDAVEAIMASEPVTVVGDQLTVASEDDTPIQPLRDDFEALALGDDIGDDEELPPLSEAERDAVSRAAIMDHALDTSSPLLVGQGAANELVSPAFIADPVKDYLTNPMPYLNEDGTPMPIGEDLQMGHDPKAPMGTPEDQAAILEYMQGKRKDLTVQQKNILVAQLLQSGGLEEALQGRSSSPALNQLFADIRRMHKQGPMLFGRPVKLKKRTSKTRKKKKH